MIPVLLGAAGIVVLVLALALILAWTSRQLGANSARTTELRKALGVQEKLSETASDAKPVRVSDDWLQRDGRRR